MKAVFVFLVLLISADIAFSVESSDATKEPSFFEQLLREVKRQEQELKGKDLNELAEKFISDVGNIGKEFVSVLRTAMAVASTGSDDQQKQHESTTRAEPTPPAMTKSSDDEKSVDANNNEGTNVNQHKEKSIMDILGEILTSTMVEDHAKARNKRDTSAAMDQGDMASLLQRLLAAQNGNSQAPEDFVTKFQTNPSSYSAESSDKNGVSTRLGKPAPIVLIPGPPGKPGVPGVPGLPGKPGKLPNFRGLKAIITTRVAELLAFLAFLAVASIGKFLGLLGLLLGLVLPVYGKLKKAGALVPSDEPSYGPSGPSYGSPYGRGKRSVAVDQAPSDKMVSYVLSKVEDAQQKFE